MMATQCDGRTQQVAVSLDMCCLWEHLTQQSHHLSFQLRAHATTIEIDGSELIQMRREMWTQLIFQDVANDLVVLMKWIYPLRFHTHVSQGPFRLGATTVGYQNVLFHLADFLYFIYRWRIWSTYSTVSSPLIYPACTSVSR